MNLIKKFALLIARQKGETLALVDPRKILWKKAIIWSLFLAIVILFSPFFYQEYQDWKNAKPEYSIANESWHVYYDDSPEFCNNNALESPNCLANPNSHMLWQSPLKRTDENHFERNKVHEGKVFWIGTQIPIEEVRRALNQQANHLYLGYFNSDIEIWLNGIKIDRASGLNRPDIDIELPFELNTSEKYLSIAIRVAHNVHSNHPDFLGGKISNVGFFKEKDVQDIKKLKDFVVKTLYVILITIEFIISSVFFFFWNTAKKKQEYFFVALLALFHMISNLIKIEYFFVKIDRQLFYVFDLVLLVLIAGTTMLLGFSYARLRKEIFWQGIPLVILFPFFVIFQLSKGQAINFYTEIIAIYLVPALTSIGGFSCLLQKWLLKENLDLKGDQKKRLKRLQYFGYSLLLIALYYFISGIDFLRAQTIVLAIWYPFIHLALIMFLSFIILLEYREQEFRLEKFTWSKHFNRELVPIHGVFLRLDLIGSEDLPSRLDSSSDYSTIASEIRVRFASLIRSIGGSVILSEGDEILAFFESGDFKLPENIGYQTVKKIAHLAQDIERELKDERKIKGDKKILFRSCLLKGTVAPFIEILPDGKHEPKWKDTTVEGGPLVLSKRLMDLEKVIKNNKDQSFLVVSEEIAKNLENNLEIRSNEWFQRFEKISNKKNQNFIVSTMVLQPLENYSLDKSA